MCCWMCEEAYRHRRHDAHVQHTGHGLQHSLAAAADDHRVALLVYGMDGTANQVEAFRLVELFHGQLPFSPSPLAVTTTWATT